MMSAECDRCLRRATGYGVHPVTGEDGQWCDECYSAARDDASMQAFDAEMADGYDADQDL